MIHWLTHNTHCTGVPMFPAEKVTEKNYRKPVYAPEYMKGKDNCD